ncbi:MAG: hypothetical protein Q8O67_32480 [Deltaproteobacteria bacterium]|nr:hypothetical protein [Deltaproteobacteria bacterium]
MIDERSPHAICVDRWLAQTAKGMPAADLLRLFEAAIAALWTETKTTLGEITLTAIVDRVLHNSVERFRLLSALTIDASGVQFVALREQLKDTHAAELRAGMRFVLIELLTVVGHLTAEILTDELHTALIKVALVDPRKDKAS